MKIQMHEQVLILYRFNFQVAIRNYLKDKYCLYSNFGLKSEKIHESKGLLYIFDKSRSFQIKISV